MTNFVKVSIFALALGVFASCGEATETPAPEAAATTTIEADTAAKAPEATTSANDTAAKAPEAAQPAATPDTAAKTKP
jgi:hypothetical protein